VKSSTATLVLRGILAVAVGVIAVAWPNITIGAFVILFAVYAFLAAFLEAARAFRSAHAGPVVGRLALAVLDFAAGAAAIAWPGITALSLVLLVAVWAFTTGTFEVILAFRAGESAGERARLALTGLVSLALAAVFAIRPDIGAVTLAQVYGLFSIVSGISLLVTSAGMPMTGRMQDPAHSPAR
jgi:uncharacterized membrane protein HdeD (DUF308 family)